MFDHQTNRFNKNFYYGACHHLCWNQYTFYCSYFLLPIQFCPAGCPSRPSDDEYTFLDFPRENLTITGIVQKSILEEDFDLCPVSELYLDSEDVIIPRYRTVEEKVEIPIWSSTEELNLLIREILQIDITPLAFCPFLRSLKLSTGTLTESTLRHLAGSNLQFLTIDCSSSNGIDLSSIGRCSSLQSLILSVNQLSELNLQPLVNCPSLQLIDLEMNYLSTLDLSPIAKCREFTHLILGTNKLIEIDLNPLGQCPHFKYLDLSCNKLTQLDLSPLENCKEFSSLILYENPLEYLDLQPLTKCPEFQEIRIFGNPKPIELNLTTLQELRNLRILDLMDTPFDYLEYFMQFKGLEELRILITDENPDLTPLSDLQDLKTLYIRGDIASIDLEPLSECPEFESLSINGHFTERIDLSPLVKCLYLSYFSFLDNSFPALPIDITPLVKCPGLSIINIETDTIQCSKTILQEVYPPAFEVLLKDHPNLIQWI